MACTLGTPGAGTRACTMRPHSRTTSALVLHQHTPCKSWWVVLLTPRVKISGLRSVCRQLHAGTCDGRVTLVAWLASHTAHRKRTRLFAVRNALATQHHNAVGSMYSNPSSVVMSLRSPHLVKDDLFDHGETAVDSACCLPQGHGFTSYRILDLLLADWISS